MEKVRMWMHEGWHHNYGVLGVMGGTRRAVRGRNTGHQRAESCGFRTGLSGQRCEAHIDAPWSAVCGEAAGAAGRPGNCWEIRFSQMLRDAS